MGIQIHLVCLWPPVLSLYLYVLGKYLGFKGYASIRNMSGSIPRNNENSVEVTCAIIEGNGHVLAAQRGARMRMPFKWEFPGGKIDPGETAEECIIREIREELGIDIRIKAMLPPSGHSYPDFHIRLHPFICQITHGAVVLTEHHAVRWTAHDQLLALDWAEADIAVVKSYIGYLTNFCQGSEKQSKF